MAVLSRRYQKSERDYDRAIEGSPERELLSAVLRRAIQDFQCDNKKLSGEAAKWILCGSAGPKAEGFSFSWVCEQLEINSELLLKKIKASTPAERTQNPNEN